MAKRLDENELLGLLRSRPKITYRHLAEFLGASAGGVHTHLKRLEQQGRVAKMPCPHCGSAVWAVIDPEE